MNSKRFYLVLDVDELYEGDKTDVAYWIEQMLPGDERRTMSVVYDTIEDMIADRDENAGAWGYPYTDLADSWLNATAMENDE